MNNEPDDLLDSLILSGLVEVSAFDPESEEMLYTFTNKFKESMPDLHRAHMNYVHSELMYFWELGIVDIEGMEEENPLVRLTEKAFDENILNKLSNEQRVSLEELKRILKVI